MEHRLIWGVRKGAPLAIPGGTATPRAFAAGARLGSLAFVWNTPLGLTIARDDGRQEDVRIVNVTRWTLFLLGGLATLTGAQVLRAELTRRVEHG